MKFKYNPTHEVRLYIGSKRGYNGDSFSKDELVNYIGEFQEEACAEYANPVRITQTTFVFNNYHEDGFEIAIINYPRSSKSVQVINRFAITLAESLLKGFEQNRISVVFPDETVMLEADDAESGYGVKPRQRKKNATNTESPGSTTAD